METTADFKDLNNIFSTEKTEPIAARSFRSKKEQSQPTELFDFDPNTASKETLMQLGLSNRIASTIDNFRSKNGKFYQPEDLKKIYGFRDEDYQRLAPYIKIKGKKTAFKKKDKHKQSTDNQKVAVLFKFNPNEANVEDFEKLGLSSKLSKRIVKYREKGGVFYKKEDLLKIYNFPEDRYEELADYIVLPKKENSSPIANSTYSKNDIPLNKANLLAVKVNLNKSTVEEFQQLRGIGPGYAKKIVAYRNKLGGFASVNQVAEIYNFPDSVFQKIKPFLIESEVLVKINVNEISEDDLKKHPYFNWKQAKALIKYRRQHGDFTDFADLKKILGIFKMKDWTRIEPYVAF